MFFGIRIADSVRELTDQERNTAYAVFLDTVDYSVVRISDGLGLDSRPFTYTVAASYSGQAILDDYISLITFPFYGGVGPVVKYLNIVPTLIYINFGPQGYKNALYDTPKFIHEMTHVWQYQHGVDVAKRSFAIQTVDAIKGIDPYAYDKPPTGDWGDYSVEQQAQIVGDWVSGGYKQNDNFRYIRDYIRKGITGKLPKLP